jgi:hypothetical protein
MPNFVSPSNRSALLPPENAIRPLMRTAFHFPKQVGSLSNCLIEALLSCGHDVRLIAIRFERSTPTDMHPGGQVLKIRIGCQLRMGRSLQCLPFIVCILWSNITPPAKSPIAIGNVCNTVLLQFDTSTNRSVTDIPFT